MKKLFLLAIVVLGFKAVSFGQVPGSASATMQIPLAVVAGTSLNFGLLSIPTTESTVTINNLDFRAYGSGSVALLPSGTIIPKTGTFDLTGQPDANLSIIVPPTIALTQGLSIATNWNTALTKLSATGTGTLLIFGELTIPASGVTFGSKTGTYNVTVSYN